MIISASYKTDIPAFYTDWFLNRLNAGVVRVTNPYGGPEVNVSLKPDDVTGYVFWTRNVDPFWAALKTVQNQNKPFFVQYTVTDYPPALDRATIPANDAVDQIRRLAEAYGPKACVWRYDPIVLTTLTSEDWHLKTFAGLAQALKGAVDEVVVSFMQLYRKTERNLGKAGRQNGFLWWEADEADRLALLEKFTAIAEANRMRLTVCGQPELSTEPVGWEAARCVDLERLQDVSGRTLHAKQISHRKTCGCWQSRDIGAYNSCPHGCVYCYAVSSRRTAKRNLAAHKPTDDILINRDTVKAD